MDFHIHDLQQDPKMRQRNGGARKHRFGKDDASPLAQPVGGIGGAKELLPLVRDNGEGIGRSLDFYSAVLPCMPLSSAFITADVHSMQHWRQVVEFRKKLLNPTRGCGSLFAVSGSKFDIRYSAVFGLAGTRLVLVVKNDDQCCTDASELILSTDYLSLTISQLVSKVVSWSV